MPLLMGGEHFTQANLMLVLQIIVIYLSEVCPLWPIQVNLFLKSTE